MKVAIMTNFQEFLPGYSLTGIVKDQLKMLKRNGDDPHLFVNEKYHGEDFPGIEIHKSVPFAHLTDYRARKEVKPEHKLTINNTVAMMEKELADFDCVFTHDWIYTGWNLPYALALQQVHNKLPNARWFHWIHSVPTAESDWWTIMSYGRGAKLIYPNETDSLLAAEQFRGDMNHVRVIHHIKDVRSFWDFDEDTWTFIDKVPQIMSADVVQLLPASADRLHAKRVREVITIFGHLNRRVNEVCLVVANQWATERQHKEDIAGYYKHASTCGLTPGQDVVFTSDIMPKYQVGIPKRMVRELFLCSNLFIFPTREESFGLVVPEAALHGLLMVLNRSLTQQYEVAGRGALFFDFGSYRHKWTNDMGDRYFSEVAQIIQGRMRTEAIRSKTFARQTYNMDALYNREYLPLMKESRVWPSMES